MKIVRYSYNGKTAFGIAEREQIAPLTAFGIPEVGTLAELAALDAEKGLDTYVAAAGEKAWKDAIPASDAAILAPCVRPPHDIICVGVNYRAHREELDGQHMSDGGSNILFFGKRCSRMTNPGETLVYDPALDDTLDYEVELAVVIGRTGKNIPREEVPDYVFGYSVFNDFSLRGTQKGRGQWYLGKSADGLSAMGPCILHHSGVAYPPQFSLRSIVNGEVRQSSHTSLFLADITDIVADASRFITLEPGDIIATGTPGGVGFGFNPPKFLHDGDSVICEISEIGALENSIKAKK